MGEGHGYLSTTRSKRNQTWIGTEAPRQDKKTWAMTPCARKRGRKGHDDVVDSLRSISAET
jgi:hypothetical protein